MSPRLRKVVLTAHVATSVGWLGSVVAYLALDVTAATSQDVDAVRGAYSAMALVAMYVVVPLALASVVIGIVNALGTPWGLIRHYWVLAKLLLTLIATAVLLIETQTVRYLGETAASAADPRQLPGTLPHSIGGLTMLLVILILSVFKPQGLTRYEWRRQDRQSRSRRTGASLRRDSVG
ncbi:hypothetical protein GCM10029976_031800 [Kribbella albertanoniae]|uniref:DUF2269 domain-containing protein n=1 Tax=Kribbella albertanoniae TaxID=1266829 RepID=A0A4R4QHB3_9ACTN|nr:DUF2269 domain-containing protein [Kribbella albertanoniae]TDC35004.1 DUF2269 domain-containing protein [Kribbella albertanoniae]